MASVTISLRNLPPDIEKALEATSRQEGISLNKAVHRLLEGALQKPARNSDFDEFFGTWSASETEKFDARLRQMRQVDPADWELAG